MRLYFSNYHISHCMRTVSLMHSFFSDFTVFCLIIVVSFLLPDHIVDYELLTHGLCKRCTHASLIPHSVCSLGYRFSDVLTRRPNYCYLWILHTTVVFRWSDSLSVSPTHMIVSIFKMRTIYSSVTTLAFYNTDLVGLLRHLPLLTLFVFSILTVIDLLFTKCVPCT